MSADLHPPQAEGDPSHRSAADLHPPRSGSRPADRERPQEGRRQDGTGDPRKGPARHPLDARSKTLAHPPLVRGAPGQAEKEQEEGLLLVTPGKDPARVYSQRRRVLALICFAVLLGLIVLSARVESAGAEGEGALVVEPELSATAAGVHTLFGASPEESPGEVWGAGESGEKGYLGRSTEAGGWEEMPAPIDAEGPPVALGSRSSPESATAGRTTPAGGVVAAATLKS